jgi:hypothetical protein
MALMSDNTPEGWGWFAEGQCLECDMWESFGPYRSWEDCDNDYDKRLRAHTPEGEEYFMRELGPHDRDFVEVGR